MEDRLENLETDVRALRKDVAEIKLTMAKQRGFVAGFAAAFSLLWAGVVALGVHIYKQVAG